MGGQKVQEMLVLFTINKEWVSHMYPWQSIVNKYNTAIEITYDIESP